MPDRVSRHLRRLANPIPHRTPCSGSQHGHSTTRTCRGFADDGHGDNAPMLSTAHRFLFIHVPKTGGNSIQNVLAVYSADHLVSTAAHQDGVERFEVRSTRYRTTKHSTLREYEREYDPSLLDGLRTICCVRNPWERCISHFFSPHRGPVEWNPLALN